MAAVGHEMVDSKESVTLNEAQTNFLAVLLIKVESSPVNFHYTSAGHCTAR